MKPPLKILLFGKSGQVGWELQRSLSPLGELVALDFDSTDYCGDFSNLMGLADTVQRLRPDVIVNAAAHTAVDKAESEPEFARTLNALAPEYWQKKRPSLALCWCTTAQIMCLTAAAPAPG